jgi:hypothetical protein
MLCPGCNMRPARLTIREWSYCEVCVPPSRVAGRMAPGTRERLGRLLAVTDPWQQLALIFEVEEALRDG